MTWQPSKQQLEDAALAGGLKLWGGYKTDVCYPTYPTYCKTRDGEMAIAIEKTDDTFTPWQPHLPTTQGKADLLDLMLAAGLRFEPYLKGVLVQYGDEASMRYFHKSVQADSEHAALARAALEVAAQVGAKMRGEV